MTADGTMAPAEIEQEPMTPAELRAWLAAQGITRAGLARRLAVHRSLITRWLEGESRIPPYLPRALNDVAAELAAERAEKE